MQRAWGSIAQVFLAGQMRLRHVGQLDDGRDFPPAQAQAQGERFVRARCVGRRQHVGI